jgi:hypothetical protein
MDLGCRVKEVKGNARIYQNKHKIIENAVDKKQVRLFRNEI